MKRPFQLVAEIQDKDAEIKRLKSLLSRAADALDFLIRFNKSNCPQEVKLIEDLRKAAE